MDACANPESTLIHDFLNSIRIRHESELDVNHDLHKSVKGIQMSDFYAVVSKVLKNSGYTDEEIQSVLHEIRRNTLPHLPLGVLEDADNAARALGLPSASFARELTLRDSDRMRGNARSKEYVLELTPSYYI